MGTRNLLPLILLLVFVGIVAAVGFIVYSVVKTVGQTTRERIERKNIALTREGMKVQVKEIEDEAYKDQTQSVLVNIRMLRNASRFARSTPRSRLIASI
ncbi:MFS transporter, putative [Penicillium digitatum]|uniref:MFS transporter, putative n=1 Tax=Penicillium digitatum TaxID=36651 RepID=A0A7T6XGZ6_PENDI|nr:MFS transporter, putative [Penicillium digitatum]